MCEKHYYYNTNRSGQLEKRPTMEYCKRATYRGKACEMPQTSMHAEYERLHGSSTHHFLPPSPPSSDASFPGSGSDGGRSHNRRSSTYIYGDRVVNVSPRLSRRDRRNSNHIVIVDPPAPHTPPRYVTPVGSPSRSPGYVHESRRESRSREYPSHGPSQVKVHVSDTRHPPHPSQSFYQSSGNKSRPRRVSVSQILDDETRARRMEHDLKKSKEAAARQRVQEEIDRANKKIASRPAAPAPRAPPEYRRGSVTVMKSGDRLVDPERAVHIRAPVYDAEYERRWREKQRAVLEEQQRLEDDAQRQRLKARMTPHRGAVSGHGHRNTYDGRWY